MGGACRRARWWLFRCWMERLELDLAPFGLAMLGVRLGRRAWLWRTTNDGNVATFPVAASQKVRLSWFELPVEQLVPLEARSYDPAASAQTSVSHSNNVNHNSANHSGTNNASLSCFSFSLYYGKSNPPKKLHIGYPVEEERCTEV